MGVTPWLQQLCALSLMSSGPPKYPDERFDIRPSRRSFLRQPIDHDQQGQGAAPFPAGAD